MRLVDLIKAIALLSIVLDVASARMLRKSRELQDDQGLCSCSPTVYYFKLDLSADCPDLPPPYPPNDVFGGGVKDYICTVGPEPGQVTSVTDLKPVSIYSIQFLEVDPEFIVINQDSKYVRGVNFVDGDEFNYTSISSLNTTDTAGGIHMVLRGYNAAGERVRNVFTITFTNKCGVPTFEVGNKIGWAVFDDLVLAPYETCPTNAPTKAPTLPTASPSQAPTIACYETSKIIISSTTGEPLNMFEVQVYIHSGANVALQGHAEQSSTFQGNETKFWASNGIDGLNETFSHTLSGGDQWWEVDLNGVYNLDRIVILNRYCRDASDQPQCLCRLSGAHVSLKNEYGDSYGADYDLGNTCNTSLLTQTFVPTCTKSPSATPSAAPSAEPSSLPSTSSSPTQLPSVSSSPTSSTSPTIACYGKTLHLQLQSFTGEQLQMFEVQAWSSGVNIALQGLAGQSSSFNDDWAKYGPYRANDGNFTTFSHTHDANAHWDLYLISPYSIDSVVIYNRWCGNSTDVKRCLCRLSYAKLTLSGSDGIVAQRTLGDTCESLIITESFTSNPECPTSTPTIMPTERPSRSPSISCYGKTKSLKLYKTKSAKEPVQMFEFQAFTSDGINVALEGDAIQSSDYSLNTVASKAIDGDNSTFSHTDPDIDDSNEDATYWSVELKDEYQIDKVVIFNRWCGDPSDNTECLCRMSGTTLYLYDDNDLLVDRRDFDDTCNMAVLTEVFQSNPACPTVSPSESPTFRPTITSPPITSSSPTITCYGKSRYVNLSSKSGEPLHMFEVQVYLQSTNAALQGSAYQSSTWNNNEVKFGASNGIDGLNETFSHTLSGGDEWWEVDLKGDYDVDRIVILNRWCGDQADSNDCMCRLSNSELRLYDENDRTISLRTLGNTCKQSIVMETFTSNPACSIASPTSSPVESPAYCHRSANQVKLSVDTGNPIQMFELQAYSSGANVALTGNAWQSSTWSLNTNASNAIDGLNETFSHTQDGNSEDIWLVNLTSASSIDSIVILNRWCKDRNDPKACLCRLSNATLTLADGNGVFASRTLGNTCNRSVLVETFASDPACTP